MRSAVGLIFPISMSVSMIALFACVSLPLVNLGLEVEVEVGFGPSDLLGVIAVLRGDLDLDLGGSLKRS
jgi:hypothetical protein